MSVISSLSKRGQYSTVSTLSEVPVKEGLMLYLDSSDEASYDVIQLNQPMLFIDMIWADWVVIIMAIQFQHQV